MGPPLTYRNDSKAPGGEQLEFYICEPLKSPGLTPGEISSRSVLTGTREGFAEEAKTRMAGSRLPRCQNRTKRLKVLKSCDIADGNAGQVGLRNCARGAKNLRGLQSLRHDSWSVVGRHGLRKRLKIRRIARRSSLLVSWYVRSISSRWFFRYISRAVQDHDVPSRSRVCQSESHDRDSVFSFITDGPATCPHRLYHKPGWLADHRPGRSGGADRWSAWDWIHSERLLTNLAH